MSMYFLLAEYKRAASAFVIDQQLLFKMWQNSRNAGRVPQASYEFLMGIVDLRAVVEDLAIVYGVASDVLAAKGQDAMNEIFASSLSYLILNSVYRSGVQIGIYQRSHHVAVDPTLGWLLFGYPIQLQHMTLTYHNQVVKFFPLGVIA